MIKYSSYTKPVSITLPGVEITRANILKMDADGITAGYISGQNLSGANDLSGNGHNLARVNIAGDYPKLISNGFGTHKVVRFGGDSKDYFNFTEITTVRAFLWIGLETVSTDEVLANFLGSDTTYYQLSRQSATDIYTNPICPRGIFWFLNGGINDTNYKCVRQAVRLNGKKISAHGTVLPTAMSIITCNFSENVRINNLGMDRVPSRIFGGDVMTLKLFSDVLTDAEWKSEIKYWGQTKGITTNISGHNPIVHNEGDSFAANGFAPNLNNGTFFESIGNFAITSVATTSAVAGSKVADVITRSDNNTIPNNVITDIIMQVGINDCHVYYLNSMAQQTSDFSTAIESLYQKLKAKQQFTHLFWGNLPQIYIPFVDTGIHQAWIDAIPYHYIYNNALAQLAINHSDVTIVDISSVSDGATAANYQTGDGLHPSGLGYYLIIQLFIAAIKTKFP